MSYLKAEFYRFAHKKSFLVLLALFTISYSTWVFFFPNASDLLLFSEMIIQMSPILIGIAIFVMVYSDDIAAHSIQIPIGYGITRWQLVLYKFIEIIAVLAGVMLYALGLAAVLNLLFQINADLSTLIEPLLITLLSTAVYASLAGFFALVSQKSSIAIIAFVAGAGNMIDSILQLLLSLRWIQNILPNAMNYIPYHLVMDISTSGWQLSNAGILGLYVVIILGITILFFNKAELEF